jgi:hypothetical protein
MNKCLVTADATYFVDNTYGYSLQYHAAMPLYGEFPCVEKI